MDVVDVPSQVSPSDELTSRPQYKKRPSILDIVETVHKLRDAYRPPTFEERELIRNWPGWGPYAPAFEKQPREQWRAIQAQLRLLLGDEYEQARRAAPTSFFTSPYLSRGIWHIATRLGFDGGSVLEPGCGTGQILSEAPPHLNLHVTGVEREPLSARIAQLLFQEAHIIQSPLQEVALPQDSFDLVVGNVPFADIAIYDRLLPIRLSLHNYFLYRALAALRPGGLGIFITSRYTLDARNTQAREILSGLGALLGAIRLPSSGHRWAGTEVITDLLVLQRRVAQAHWGGHSWVKLAQLETDGVSIETNAYFASCPEQILGTVSLGHGMYRDNELRVLAPPDLEKALETATRRLVEEATRHQYVYVQRSDPTKFHTHLTHSGGEGLKEGNYYLLGEGLVQIVDGEPKAATRMVAELSEMVRVRDAALALLEAERDPSQTDEQLLPLRETLNRLYDAYVARYGPFHQAKLIRQIDKKTGEETIIRRLRSAMYAARTDEHYPLLLGLETYDDETGTAQKAAIFSRRVNIPPVYKETADSREEAIALSLDRFGALNLAFLAKALGHSETEIVDFLGDLVYEDPEERAWQIAPLYLSGNVRRKLEIARRALTTDPKWQRNVDALTGVQPELIPPEDIKVLLGAPWIPVPSIVQFCTETFRLTPQIAHDKLTGKWVVVPPLGTALSVEVTSTWGTARVSAFRLLEHLLNHRTTQVVDEDSDGKTHLNTEETMLAQQKRKEIGARFSTWIWEDQGRAEELAALYNKLYNGMVPSTYSGNHLSFPGMDAYWQEHLYSWQRDFIARMITTRSALCAYPVGAGKTKIQVAGAMTLGRMQLAHKPTILVPNHLIEQITSEAKQLYSSARILMISREDLSRERRRIFLARIATGDYDLIVMTHSAFGAIDVHQETRAAFIRQEITEYEQVLYSIDQDSTDRAEQRRIKHIEKELERMEENLKQLLDTPHDPGITFEQLGISYLLVDECHLFKNLGLPTNQEKLQAPASGRAKDLLMKLRWLEQHNGKRPFASFFSATPISNSMVESYVMIWYLSRGLLREYGLETVDDFASMYIETQAQMEATPNGDGFRMYERPRAFVNLPEFLHLFASIADIRSPDILAEKRPQRMEHTISVEPTPEVIAYVNTLVKRSEKLQQGCPLEIGGREDNMLWVTGDGRKAALWLGLHGIQETYPAKLDAIASEMARVYQRWQEKAAYLPGTYKSFQIGFCDLGTPNREDGDQVYGEIKRLLIEKGVSSSGIRYIHEAESDAAKTALFEQCRTGGVAILLGSTAKLGTGTNIQTRCAAIHHCDAPWRPDEVEQREGRGQRPGNLYPVVEIFYYVQRRTFDVYTWQILSNKARFFNQVRSSTVTSREIAYSDDSSLTYGQVKAAATGDVLLLEHANVSLSVDGYSRLHTAWLRARERDTREARRLRTEVELDEDVLKRYQKIERKRATSAGGGLLLTPDRRLLSKKEECQDFIAREVLQAIHTSARLHRIGEWQGVPIFFKFDAASRTPYVITFDEPFSGVDVPCSARSLAPENHWHFAWYIERFFELLPSSLEKLRLQIQSKRERAVEFEIQSQTLFPHQQPWQTSLSRKRELDRYIEMAASATSTEALQQLAEFRQTLLQTAPKNLVEQRPRPTQTATCVLPPRNPNATQEGVGTSITPIEGVIPCVTAPTIEEVARTIQQHVAGSSAMLVFGDLEQIKLNRKRRRIRGTARTASLPSQTREKEAPIGTQHSSPASASPKLPTLWDEPPNQTVGVDQLSLW